MYFFALAMRAVSLFTSRAATLIFCISQLCPLMLMHAGSPLTKSEEKERIVLAV